MLPDPILANQPPITPPPTFPEIPDIPPLPDEALAKPGAPSGPTDLPDLPPIISPPKKKFGGKKIIATILGILLLVGGVGVGVALVQQQQDIREKAYSKACKVCENGNCKDQSSPCIPDINQCENNSGCRSCDLLGNEKKEVCTDLETNCLGEKNFICKAVGNRWEWVNIDPDDICWIPAGSCTLPTPTPRGTSTPTPPITCSLTGNEICVGNIQTGPCYQGGQRNQYACYKLKGNPGKVISGSNSCTCPAPYTWGPREEMGKNWCFNTAIRCDGQYPYAERCSLQPQQCPGGTPTPTPPGETAACLNIKAYDTSWNQLTAAQLSSLIAGNHVRFTVSGSPANKIDKAKFKINGADRPETSAKKPGTDEYYDEYTIPAETTSFTVNAKLHHVSLGWF